jgi:hypothetical protein
MNEKDRIAGLKKEGRSERWAKKHPDTLPQSYFRDRFRRGLSNSPHQGFIDMLYARTEGRR